MGVTTSSTVAATYEPIETKTISSATATVTFSSISGSYTDLVLVAIGKTTEALAKFKKARARFLRLKI